MSGDKGQAKKITRNPVQEGFHFQCTACGLCCRWGGQVYLYPDDAHRLAGHLNLIRNNSTITDIAIVSNMRTNHQEILIADHCLAPP